eukprot:10878865-Karenia_brevis.AAC.1
MKLRGPARVAPLQDQEHPTSSRGIQREEATAVRSCAVQLAWHQCVLRLRASNELARCPGMRSRSNQKRISMRHLRQPSQGC